MKRVFQLGGALSAVLLLLPASCGSEAGDDDIGTIGLEATKCSGGTPGDSNYCSEPGCTCDLGEGDCDTDQECSSGLSCTGKGLYFCYATPVNVCAAAHCANKLKDGDETQVDCGGSCGTCCPDPCANLPANGLAGHCTVDCPCDVREGDCAANNNNCDTSAGLQCFVNVGARFGFDASIDMCLASTCANGVMDGDETGVDCGPSCANCGGGAIGNTSYGGTGRDHGFSVVHDRFGNIIVAGRFDAPASFGGSTLPNAGLSDVWVAKYSATGAHLWSKAFGGTGPDGDLGVGVGVDGSGNVVVASNFWNTVNFGGGFNLSSVGSADIFVAKLNASGGLVWAKRFGGISGDRANGVSVKSTGEIFVAGGYMDSVDFGGGTRTSAGNYDALIMKLDANGNHLYSNTYGSTSSDQAIGIAIDSGGNAFVTGIYAGSVTFGATTLTAAGVDGFVTKVLAGSTVHWAKSFGGTSSDAGLAIGLDASRNPVVGGRFRGTADFGAGAVTSAGGSDAMVVAYTNLGAYRWSKTFGGTGEDRVNGVAIDAADGVVSAVGDFQNTIDMGTGAKTSLGANDMFVVSYANDGTLRAANAYGGAGTDFAFAAAARSGVLTVTGDFEGTADFGSGTLTSAGMLDVFLARYTY